MWSADVALTAAQDKHCEHGRGARRTARRVAVRRIVNQALGCSELLIHQLAPLMHALQVVWPGRRGGWCHANVQGTWSGASNWATTTVHADSKGEMVGVREGGKEKGKKKKKNERKKERTFIIYVLTD